MKNKQMMIRCIYFLFALLPSALAFSADVSGVWKHAKNPAWIEVSLQEGTATVVRNDKSPERVGREILKNVKASSTQQNMWHGQIYIEKLGKYKGVEISLSEAGDMLITGKVGFFSRSTQWLRVDTFTDARQNELTPVSGSTL